jgi:hypothetical protein
MTSIRKLLALATSVGALVIAGRATAAVTDGFTQYSNTYTVQNWTSGCGGFSDLGGGQFKTWVCAGESRVEMRWADWPNQTIDNQFECDAMFDSNTQATAIHQIKSNTGGEVIYLQVQSPGTLRNDNGTVFSTGMSGTWFHINSIFNPSSGDGSAYINGSLKVIRHFATTDRAWYFKNGCYNNGLPTGGVSTAWFKNIKSWVKSSSGNTDLPGHYKITNRNSGKAIVVQSASTSNSAAVVQSDYTSASPSNDEWSLILLSDGNYEVSNRNSAKAMVVQSASTSPGAKIIQYDFGGSNTNDEWQIVDVTGGYFKFVNAKSGLTLGVPGNSTSNGTQLDQETDTGGSNQQFQIVSVP